MEQKFLTLTQYAHMHNRTRQAAWIRRNQIKKLPGVKTVGRLTIIPQNTPWPSNKKPGRQRSETEKI